MRRVPRLTTTVLAIWLVPGLLSAQQSEATKTTASYAELGDLARFSLSLAIREIDECCEGRLVRAELKAQRRWAYALFSWTVHTAGSPDWSRLRESERFSKQAAELLPGYVARLAIHPVSWLREHPTEDKTTNGAAFDRDRFVDQIRAYGVVERQLRVAERSREERIRSVELDFRDAVVSAGRLRSVIEQELALAEAEGRPADVAGALALIQQDQSVLADRISARIKVLQREFWDWEEAWIERSRDQEMASKEQAVSLAQFQSTATAYNEEIMKLTDRLEELESGLEELGTLRPEQLKEIERPSISRPILSTP